MVLHHTNQCKGVDLLIDDKQNIMLSNNYIYIFYLVLFNLRVDKCDLWSVLSKFISDFIVRAMSENIL